jgi:hypothetical protein
LLRVCSGEKVPQLVKSGEANKPSLGLCGHDANLVVELCEDSEDDNSKWVAKPKALPSGLVSISKLEVTEELLPGRSSPDGAGGACA